MKENIWYPHTKLGCLNFFILQWGFIRLAKSFKNQEDLKAGKIEKWVIIGPVLPFSGWWTSYAGFYKNELWSSK